MDKFIGGFYVFFNVAVMLFVWFCIDDILLASLCTPFLLYSLIESFEDIAMGWYGEVIWMNI